MINFNINKCAYLYKYILYSIAHGYPLIMEMKQIAIVNSFCLVVCRLLRLALIYVIINMVGNIDLQMAL